MELIILSGLGLALYIVPSVVAGSRRHHQTLAIVAVNVLLGWTFLGWAVALIWALTKVDTSGRPEHVPGKPSPFQIKGLTAGGRLLITAGALGLLAAIYALLFYLGILT